MYIEYAPDQMIVPVGNPTPPDPLEQVPKAGFCDGTDQKQFPMYDVIYAYCTVKTASAR